MRNILFLLGFWLVVVMSFAQKATGLLFVEVEHFPNREYYSLYKDSFDNTKSNSRWERVELVGQLRLHAYQPDSFVVEAYHALLEQKKVLLSTYTIDPFYFTSVGTPFPADSWVKITAIYQTEKHPQLMIPQKGVVEIYQEPIPLSTTPSPLNTRRDGVVIMLEIDSIITQAKAYCRRWFRKNRKKYDVNNFKKSPYFKEIRLSHVKNIDFNKTVFEPAAEAEGLDYNRKLVFIHVGKNVLYEDKIQRGDFISFVAAYNFEKHRIEKVLVYNSGYFLE